MSQAGGRDSKQQSWLVMGVQQDPATAVAVVVWGLVVGEVHSIRTVVDGSGD
jgi:hypothetical protein